MTFARPLLLCLALLGCDARRAKAPDWVQSAPAATAVAISCRAGWALEQPRLQAVLARFPAARAALDAFLLGVHLDPRRESGRFNVYLANPAAGYGLASADVLIQLGGFRDPGRLQVAIADAFPSEGSLAMDNRDLPLFVVLEQPPRHVRAMADSDGRVWLGDLATLNTLGSQRVRSRGPLQAATGWIAVDTAVQGFIRPQQLLEQAAPGLPGDLARDLPRGIAALAWGITPAAAAGGTFGFELALTGPPEAVQRAAAWLQRFLAAIATLPGAAAQNPEILQERQRIGLRCQLSREQLALALARLGLPPMPAV